MSTTTTTENTNRFDASNAESRTPLKLPKKNYKLRIVEEPEFKVSKTDKDMLVFKFEIVAHESGATTLPVKDSDGNIHELNVEGLELMFWAVFVEYAGQVRNFGLESIHKAGGLPLAFNRNPETGLPEDDNGTPLSYRGIELFAQCEGKEEQQKDEDGQPLKNPLTGKEVKSFSRRIVQIYSE